MPDYEFLVILRKLFARYRPVKNGLCEKWNRKFVAHEFINSLKFETLQMKLNG